MELLVLLLIVAVLVLFAQLGTLKARIRRLEAGLVEPGPTTAQPISAAASVEAEAGVRLPAAAPPEATAPVAAPPPRRGETLGGLFERWVAGRLLIWLGGAALVLAAIFLIRYSIEIGLVTPAARMAGAAALGLACIGAGEYARRGRLFVDDPRIAQALVGAGLAILYATAYGSHILYGLLGAGAASAAMIAITLAALGLSLRHGAPTAAMGLVGGFLTPLLVGNPNAEAVPLLAYLALLDVAMFAIAWRRGWTWLAACAVLLSFLWTGFLLTRPPGDALAAGLFVVLLAVAASLVRAGPGRQMRLIQPLAIAAVELALLVARTDLGLAGWLLYGALGAASVALAVIRDEFRPAPAAALGLALVLLFAKALTGADLYAPQAAIGIALLFGGAGLGISLWRGGVQWAAIAAVGLAGPLLVMRAARPDLLAAAAWGALALLLALGPVLLVWTNRRRASTARPADRALLAAGASAALLAGAAVWDLAPRDLAAAGWLAVAVLAALAARRLGDLALASIATLAAVAGVGRAASMVPQLSTAILTALIGQPVLGADLPGMAISFDALALPASLLIALRLALPPVALGAQRALPAVAGLFVVTCAYVWFKQAFGLAGGADFVARGVIERTIVTQALFAAGWALASGRVTPPRMTPETARLGGTWLTIVAAARLVWLDMLWFNPVWADQWVGAIPLLNWILPAYLASAAWLYAAWRRVSGAAATGAWLAAFLAALLLGAALLVRQLFQGGTLTGPTTPIAEYYGYSLAGIALAIGLIVAGMRLPDKALRLAGLALLTATICKVFLADAAALTGVLRILSFLGLGIALIGIGRLYGPVLRIEKDEKDLAQA